MSDRIFGMKKLRLAVIGLGERAVHMARMVCQADGDARVTAVVDPRGEVAVQTAARMGLPDCDDIRVLNDIDTLVEQAERFDGVIIGTPCNLHSPAAVQVAATNLPVFLEKPVAVSWPQLQALADAYRGREGSVVVSFPLRLTSHVQTAAEILQSGRLGTINQLQAVNNVPYGGVYFGHWYRDYGKSSGLWLQKATHDFDYINYLIACASPGAYPVSVAAMHSRTVYGGTLPADLKCSKCDRTAVCPESPVNLTRRGSDGGMLNYASPMPDSDHACAFSCTIYNQDAGSALLMYSDGAHASYSQNFLTRASAGLRGATITGYEATLRFDWQSDIVTVIDHHRDRVDRIEITANGSHGGGDAALAQNFVAVLRGTERSRCPLDQGLLSAAMCLAARDAAQQGVNQEIPVFARKTVSIPNLQPRGIVEPAPIDTAKPALPIHSPSPMGV
jgi:predicted dehydrogenase